MSDKSHTGAPAPLPVLGSPGRDGAVLAVQHFNGVARYRTVVVETLGPAYRLLLVDLDGGAFCHAGELEFWMPGLPLRSLVLALGGELHLAGLLEPEPQGASLNLFWGSVAPEVSRQLFGLTYDLHNRCVVADLGPAAEGRAISHLTTTDARGEVLWQAIAHPMVELRAVAVPFESLEWRTGEAADALLALCDAGAAG